MLNTSDQECESNEPELSKKNGEVSVKKAANNPILGLKIFCPSLYVNQTPRPANNELIHTRMPNCTPNENRTG